MLTPWRSQVRALCRPFFAAQRQIPVDAAPPRRAATRGGRLLGFVFAGLKRTRRGPITLSACVLEGTNFAHSAPTTLAEGAQFTALPESCQKVDGVVPDR